MEKSSCIELTQNQLDLINNGDLKILLEIMDKWTITSVDELKTVIDTGQYRLVDEN